MALPITETWTGTTGAAWPSPWTTGGTTAATATIQANAGQLNPGSLTGYTAGVRAYYGDTGASDFDISYDFTVTNNEHYPTVAFRIDGVNSGYYTYSNGYHIEIQANSNTATLFRMDSGTRTDIIASTAVTGMVTFTAATNHMRIRCTGNRIRYRIWQGATEPTFWHFIAIDSNHATRGGFAFTVSGGAGGTSGPITYDNLSIVVPPAEPYPVQEIGRATAAATGGTLSVNFSGTEKPQIGDWIVARVSRDNITNDPATGDSISATPGGETYTRTALASPTGTSTALAGVVGAMFYGQVVTAWPSGTNTVTWSMPSTVVVAKSIVVEHWTNVALVRASSAASGGSTAGAASATTGASLATGDVAIGMIALEHSSASAITGDADTTNGSWSPIIAQNASSGTTLAAVKVSGQYKVVTGAGTQTYNPTNSVTASVDAVAIVIGLVPPSIATLGTATFSFLANDLTVGGGPSTANLGTASLGLSAYNLIVGTGPYDWNSTVTDWNDASVDWNAPSAGLSSNLGTGSFPLIANDLGSTRTLGSATVAYSANNLGSTHQLGTATLAPIANGLTFGGQILPSASLALAANLLGTSYQFSTATLALTAYGLTVAAVTATANLGNATVGFTANPFTFNDAIAVIAASLGISANALGFTDSISASTATLGLAASNLADSETTTAASLGLAATGLASTRSFGTATVPFSASGITTAGYALASASITAIANNLSLIGSFNLGTATVAFSASNLNNQTTGQSTLGRADLTVNAGNLSVSLSAGLSASLAMSATNLARAAVVGTSSLSVDAQGLTQLRIAALGLASLVTTAYNMSQSAPGTAALGSGTLLLSANPMSRFALLSAGLATVALDAFAVGPKVNASSAVGSMSTAAQPMSSTRAVAKGILDLTAYGFGTYRPSTLGTAALTITAYALSAQTGKSKGRISVRNGYVQFKTGGRGRTGLVTANPVSSFKKVGG